MSDIIKELKDGVLGVGEALLYECPVQGSTDITSINFDNLGGDTVMWIKLKRRGQTSNEATYRVAPTFIQEGKPARLIQSNPREIFLEEGDQLIGASENGNMQFIVFGIQLLAYDPTV